MKKLGKLYHLINVLSLDVVAGAIVSSLFFARIFGVVILPWGLGALGLTVWSIYTLDHLMDAKRLSADASSHRHRFHQKHFATLTVILCMALLIDVILISFLRRPVFYSGLVLAGAVVIYSLTQQNLKYIKELAGALLYSLGVLLPAWSLSSAPLEVSQGIFIAEFCIIVLCNLLLFSLFDHEQDLRDHVHSFTTVMGERYTRQVLAALFILNGVLMLVHLFWLGSAPGTWLSVVSMNAILFLIFRFREHFKLHDRYRLWGDAIFMVPLLLFIG